MSTTVNEPLQEYRCPSCNKLLFKGLLLNSAVQIKCKKCYQLVLFHRLASSKGDTTYRAVISRDGTIANTSVNLGTSPIGTPVQALLARLGHPNSLPALLKSWDLDDHSMRLYALDETGGRTMPDSIEAAGKLWWHFLQLDGNEYMVMYIQPAEADGLEENAPETTPNKTEATIRAIPYSHLMMHATPYDPGYKETQTQAAG